MSESHRRSSLLEAIQDKYESKEPLHIQIFVPKSAPGKTDSGNLVLPRELTLDNCQISHAGKDSEIAQLHADVHALDLAGNLLREWREVFRILDQFPDITFLNLSRNPLTTLDQSLDNRQYENMVKLVLNCIHLPWEDVQQVLTIIPNLEELHISINDFKHINVTDQTPYPTLRLLHINTNGLTDWEDVEKLGRFFPNLEQLCMIENPIREISVNSEENVSANFPHLEAINISSTAVASWKELEKFCLFPKLHAIRLKGIPLLEGYDEAERRNLVIGFLPNITMLNGSHVKPSEREDAERAFLRHYVNKDEKPTRYDDLVAVYGMPAPLAEVDLSPQWSVDVLLRFEEKRLLRNVDVRWTLQELKKELVDFVGHPAKNFRVFLNDPESWIGTEELRLPSKKMFSYGVKDGVEILIELKPSCDSCKK